jgi:diaminohydroxyphosphoribosylaminopyrimidine deaminase/5-amino-6-(5-phosphoribosylamino)uracil reductase
MHRALELAERGRGLVEPNPLVGAVVVRGGSLVGEGWHQRYGEAHAEVNALSAAGGEARGATLYVTLEPCCHHGKTPPCTDAIVGAGVGRVIAAMRDPFPQVAGQGIERLRAAGIDVEVGASEEQAEELNAPFLTLVRAGRPYVHAKWAMSLDGRIATRRGDSRWISGPASREIVHRLRGRMDAILVGAGTVRADDPLLTARPPGPRTPIRIVLSRSGTLPAGCKLLQTVGDAPVLIATIAGNGVGLRKAGCTVLELPGDNGCPSVPELLAELGRRRMTNLLIEGGAEVFGGFCDQRLVDEFHVFVAPRIIGGAAALSPVGGSGAAELSQSWPLARWTSESAGTDVYFHGWAKSHRRESVSQ